jgi:hypothetical protein
MGTNPENDRRGLEDFPIVDKQPPHPDSEYTSRTGNPAAPDLAAEVIESLTKAGQHRQEKKQD